MALQGHGGQRYLIPISTGGVVPDPDNTTGPGAYTLLANTTYHYPLGGEDFPYQSVHLTGYSATAVVTAAKVRDSNHDRNEVSDRDTTAGHWIPETPPDAYVGVEGTGWSMSSAGVAAATGAGVGGA